MNRLQQCNLNALTQTLARLCWSVLSIIIYFRVIYIYLVILLTLNVTLSAITLQTDHAIANMNKLPRFSSNLWMSCLRQDIGLHHANDLSS